MKTRYRLIRRGNRGDAFYCVDTTTGKRTSLRTSSEEEAQQVIEAKNQAGRQPVLNLQIAKAYLAGTDNGIATRTWRDAIEALTNTKHGANKERWQRVLRDYALAPLWPRAIIETPAEVLLKALQIGTVATNVYLRRLHNFCGDMNWLPWPIIPKRQWPAVRYKSKRAITAEEHQRIIDREHNPTTRAYYQLLWHLGGAQTDIATLTAEDVDWQARTIAYQRCKTGVVSLISFGEEVAAILNGLPKSGQLFPALARIHQRHRSKLFIQRLASVGIKGVSLHSYRYAWAERAMEAGYPERFAMQALGHTSKAVHRAYSRKAQVTMPPLEDYEKRMKAVIVPLPIAANV